MGVPPIVTGLGEASPGERLDRRVELLRRFIVLDVVTCALSGTAVMILAFTLIDDLWAAFAAGAVYVAGAVMASALIPLRRGSLATAFVLLASANWGVSLICALVAPISWPIQVLAALLPAVAAGPYTTAAQSRIVAIVSFAVAGGVAALGVLQDVTGLTDSAPTWVVNTIMIVFTPFMAVLMVRAGQASSNELQSLLEDTQRVNAELSASRARVVAATDEARRKIERDLHDGAQQRLVGLTLQLTAAREQLRTDPHAADATLAEVREQVRLTQNELRSLVRGVYPPVLTEHGLGAALQALAVEQARPIRTHIATTRRLTPEAEAAGYFCALEALQNATKHAGPDATIDLDLVETDDGVAFIVSDDGRGFAEIDVADGHGFTNMADRLGAAGGHLEIRSDLGDGTTVRGFLPVGR
ncbi:MAG: histidine kinase [Actinomycetota bacterium]